MQGWAQHERAKAALLESWNNRSRGAPVRLAKPTSNLFRPRTPTGCAGLDVSGFVGVIEIDPIERVAQVQGMCTYENLVAKTLAYGLLPTVVPQLRTITLGGAVTGLGIESTSLRLGLPHEAVEEMEIFTGGGEFVLARADNEHAQLFDAFANSYGSLGYAVRLKIRLEPAARQVHLRHVRFTSIEPLLLAIEEVAATGAYDAQQVDAIDGVAFSPSEFYLTLARFENSVQPASNYTGQKIYYRSIQQRQSDVLTMNDYLWRWDTDWFWCSAAFGAQNPIVRCLWPRRFRRSDVYHRLVGLDAKLGLSRLLDRAKAVPGRERVIQDVEVPLEKLPEFLSWFDRVVGMRPIWLCPLRTKKHWPTYGLEPGRIYVNVGFWGTVVVLSGTAAGAVNQQIEARVRELGGHKSLYSESFYDRDTFDSIYDTAGLDQIRKQYDPTSTLETLFEKAVRNS